MSSIAGTLNSINSSLLAEIKSFSPATSNSASSTQSSSPTDRFDFSQAGSLFSQLQQLQSSNPAEFKQVLTDAVTKLKDAANQQTNPKAAAFLNNLADRFQKAADTGDLSALHPQSPSGGARAHRGHHPRGAESENDGDKNDSGSSTTSSSQSTSQQTTTASLLSYLTSSGNGQQDLFSLLTVTQSGTSGDQSGLSGKDLLAAILTSASSATTSGQNSSQIQSLLASFITSTGSST